MKILNAILCCGLLLCGIGLFGANIIGVMLFIITIPFYILYNCLEGGVCTTITFGTLAGFSFPGILAFRFSQTRKIPNAPFIWTWTSKTAGGSFLHQTHHLIPYSPVEGKPIDRMWIPIRVGQRNLWKNPCGKATYPVPLMHHPSAEHPIQLPKRIQTGMHSKYPGIFPHELPGPWTDLYVDSADFSDAMICSGVLFSSSWIKASITSFVV